jgi:hypothetical protein
MDARATLGSMNPIALIEATAASRSAVLGALATDPVVPSRPGRSPASRPRRRPVSAILAEVSWLSQKR